ncbi:hypothetical protein OAF63_02430 [Saprospiraceae bacterium]|nr:hypothetical protein [Saprospiraceae bacterium]
MPWVICLFGFPSTAMLINLPIKNPRKINAPITNEVKVKLGKNIPNETITPPLSINALTPLISFSK